MALATLPQQVAEIEKKLRLRFPHATVQVDAPSDPKGSWFLDVKLKDHIVTIEWKDTLGFSVTTNPSARGYGEKGDENYHQLSGAYNRVAALLLGGTSSLPPQPVRLRELRALRTISQVELAESLSVRQAAISRLEHRKDILVSTLNAVVTAMGGELVINAKFPDGLERRLEIFDDKGKRPTRSLKNPLTRS